MSTYSVFDNIITLHCTDGSSNLRPDPSEDTITRTWVDYMEECKGNHPTLKSWKEKIGTFLAGYVLQRRDAERRRYTLSSLPVGYSLFLHKKGERANPRMDAYLWGSTTGAVFRSPAEFFFHAKWIMLGCPLSGVQSHDAELFGKPLPEEYENRCGCTYCAGTDQTYISSTFSNYNPKKKRRG